MNINDIRCILIVGMGTMGQKIALQCATHGYEVIAYDVSRQSLETARANIKCYAEQLVDQKRLTPEESNVALARISFTTNPDEGTRVDLLSESVPEDPDLKAKVFAQFNRICPPHTIFTTNTSTLVPSLYAEATGRMKQFVALHFYGVWDHNLADIMPHPGTSPETVKIVTAFAKRIGQVPFVFKKEIPEYVANAILAAIASTALKLVFVDEVASVEDVDRAQMIVMGMPIGPFGWLDYVGLDTVLQITQRKAEISDDTQLQTEADRLKSEYVDKGWLGVKSGRGFYTYPDPAYAHPDFLTGAAGS
ncbi:MAG: 3-hydroxyacyl-CoA dehydrogenase [Deltaproteobacteria bacterium]